MVQVIGSKLLVSVSSAAMPFSMILSKYCLSLAVSRIVSYCSAYLPRFLVTIALIVEIRSSSPPPPLIVMPAGLLALAFREAFCAIIVSPALVEREGRLNSPAIRIYLYFYLLAVLKGGHLPQNDVLQVVLLAHAHYYQRRRHCPGSNSVLQQSYLK